MRNQGIDMAEREYRAVVESIRDDASNTFNHTSAQLTEDQITEATDQFTHGMYPWDMVVDKRICHDIMSSDRFLSRRVLDTTNISHPNGSRFIGKYGWMNVFEAPYLEKQCIIFDKHEVHVIKTETECSFDRDVNPEWFSVSKQVTSGAVIRDAVVVIDLNY